MLGTWTLGVLANRDQPIKLGASVLCFISVTGNTSLAFQSYGVAKEICKSLVEAEKQEKQPGNPASRRKEAEYISLLLDCTSSPLHTIFFGGGGRFR